jgi:hypothetical protein
MQHLRIATLLVFGIVTLGGVETAWADVFCLKPLLT